MPVGGQVSRYSTNKSWRVSFLADGSLSANSTDPASALTTFANTPSRASEIVATGAGSDLYVINIHRGSVVRRVSLPSRGPVVSWRSTRPTGN